MDDFRVSFVADFMVAVAGGLSLILRWAREGNGVDVDGTKAEAIEMPDFEAPNDPNSMQRLP